MKLDEVLDIYLREFAHQVIETYKDCERKGGTPGTIVKIQNDIATFKMLIKRALEDKK